MPLPAAIYQPDGSLQVRLVGRRGHARCYAFHMSTLERAIQIAAAAHAGQIDKAGQPYILHPLRVMLRVTSEHERIAAILHDVVEDTDITHEQLATEGFDRHVMMAVEALTKHPGETRLQAAARAAADPIARAVKLADNTENMDLSRITSPTEKDFARLREYEEVRALLLSQVEREAPPFVPSNR